jgi:hypothetical protein
MTDRTRAVWALAAAVAAVLALTSVVIDLHALLAAAQVPGPYLLVAHSLAQSYPDQVRSLFFVDDKTEPFPLPPNAPAGLGPTLDRVWPQGALSLVALRPQTTHILATGSDHYIQVHQPDLVMAITELLIDRSAQPPR